MKRMLLAFAALLTTALPVHAQDDVASFYKGKVVRLIVGVGVGSGYDINARLVARYLPKYIPGNPSVIVQNQPGAGSLTMTNQMYAAGPFGIRPSKSSPPQWARSPSKGESKFLRPAWPPALMM